MPQRKKPPAKSTAGATTALGNANRATRANTESPAVQAAAHEQRLHAIEARLAAIETRARSGNDANNALSSAAKLTVSDDRYWALNELNRQSAAKPTECGAVLYAGSVSLPSGAHYVWQRQDSTRSLLDSDWRDLSETITALAHPVRLGILKHALAQDRSTQDFMSLPEMGTTGQLFHHIKALQEAGWLRSLQRGQYGVPGERVVPLLAILSAARG
jgi:hypothetical protein